MWPASATLTELNLLNVTHVRDPGEAQARPATHGARPLGATHTHGRIL